MSDAHGRKPMLLLSQLGTLAGFLMLAFLNDLAMLFASRVRMCQYRLDNFAP